MRIDRRSFLLLTAALVTAVVTTPVKSQPRCSDCGRAIQRGSRAHLLPNLGDYPEDALCLHCLASGIDGPYDLISDDGHRSEGRTADPRTATRITN